VLLIQVRDTEDVARHERDCVLERTGLSSGQLDRVNLVDEPGFDFARIKDAGAVIIGGAGAHSAVDDNPWNDVLAEYVRRMVLLDKPLFGSCYGHQFMARALGGRVIRDPDRSEVGVRDITLTDAAGGDPIFGGGPTRFAALMGHNDRVETLPGGCVELARSEVCGNQAFRVEGKPVYGTQFHSELSPERLFERIEVYRHIYMPDDEEFARFKGSLRPAPEANQILRRFLERVAV